MKFNSGGSYLKTEAWIYKWGAVFSTHEAQFYLDENKKIVWLSCDRILSNSGMIWTKTESIVYDWLWKNILYWINNSGESESKIMDDVNIVYEKKIVTQKLSQFINWMQRAKNMVCVDKSLCVREYDTSKLGKFIDLEIVKVKGNYSVRWANIDPEYTKDVESRIIQVTLVTKEVLEKTSYHSIQEKINIASEVLLAENNLLFPLIPIYCENKKPKSWK